MLYDKWKTSEFSEETFKNPGSEFRGTPFWAWNSTLEPETLKKQVDVFSEMGFGGFHMHVRQGLATEYLGKDFMGAVNACIERAEDNKMLAWLYDEDRWPSGCAGGFVTNEYKYRIKALLMTCEPKAGAVYDWHDAVETGKKVFVAAFSVKVNEAGIMTSYEPVGEYDECENKRIFYCVTAQGREPRYNYQSYVDALSKPAIDKFIKVTHESFKAACGDKFGNTVPAIFTDEPQIHRCGRLDSGHSKGDVRMAWTWDFPETFEKAYGFDLVGRLPELFFKMEDESDQSVRYFYYRHLSERFSEAYTDNIGDWCEKNNIMLTGHMMCEDNLTDITYVCTDPMRSYKNMQLPGIDVLFDRRLFTTAKQCESIVRQMGREGMLSELYGVTNWDYDFRGHKSQGDWQACLGVTVRVPHLAWQTMKGEGKRDYPASIFYQSPWYKQYKIIEDHYARVNTALSRGKAVSHIAVLHPMESFFCKCCSKAESDMECRELDKNFAEVCDWLLLGSVNFDYIAESMLPYLTKEGTAPLNVGQMQYDTVILDSCENLRPYTIDVLCKFVKAGGKLIISGNTPSRSLGKLSDEAKELVSLASVVIPHSRSALMSVIENERDVVVRNANGTPTEDILYTRRTEGNTDWLFVCHAYAPELAHIPSIRQYRITVKGLYKATLYDTVSGEILPIEYSAKNGVTDIFHSMSDYDSLLLRLDKIESEDSFKPEEIKTERVLITTPFVNNYRLEEPNPLVLDMAEWSLDGGELQPTEEILRIDETVRKSLGLTVRAAKCVQPWAVAGEPEDHKLYLKFTVNSEIEYEGATFALENLATSDIVFNGEKVNTAPVGYYIDWEVHTCALPKIKKGSNILEITIPFGVRTDVENCFVLGNFGTAYRGREAWICSLPEDLAYGNVVNQGLAFYGASIFYDSEFELDEPAPVEFQISYYRGALVKVEIDGQEAGYIWKSPFRLRTDVIPAGKHNVTYTLYGNRYNTLVAHHSLVSDKKDIYTGPGYWHSTGFEWSYEYNTRPMGILKAPEVYKIINKK